MPENCVSSSRRFSLALFRYLEKGQIVTRRVDDALRDDGDGTGKDVLSSIAYNFAQIITNCKW